MIEVIEQTGRYDCLSHSAILCASEAETKAHTFRHMLSPNRISGSANLMKPPHKVVAKNKAGCPPTRAEPLSAIQLPPKLTAAIDKWTEENGVTSRSEVIRRLVELGLAASQPLRRRNLEAVPKALELAAKEIDKLLEPSIPEEKRHRRKRRLLKGPKEFRDIRGDLSKHND